LATEKGLDLRSRCLLWPEHELKWEVLGQPGSAPSSYSLDAETALALLKEAVEGAEVAGLPWRGEPLVLKPSSQLAALVQKSQELAVAASTEGGEEG
jgi:CRISPR-associated protein Csb1